jgi:hypothetical protein
MIAPDCFYRFKAVEQWKTAGQVFENRQFGEKKPKKVSICTLRVFCSPVLAV